ncbi:Fibrous sheath-interacting protein 2 [Myotis davidii]|uniref:Fibrous sheath-interacting protein 2 n=1 Tax=Myotis davidii TaxID=225400 RepID=L5LNU9_MYODS|nr:Fibrous sheath-interacting protein 2 [Myotis davidii]
MELYLNFCSKKAKADSIKTATSSLGEEKMLTRQVNRLQDNNQLPGRPEVTQFQNWMLMDRVPSFRDQERLIRHRYLDMINRELEYRERRAEEQRRLWMDREDRRHWDHVRRKLGLRRKIEEEWKTKEMLLLTRIVEDVKREARIEEQRRRNREENDRKKQVLLEKKMAYHLQKMQQNGLRREDTGKNTPDYRGQEGACSESYIPMRKKKASEDIKTIYTVGDQKPHKGGYGAAYTSAPDTLLSAQNSPTGNFHKSSQSYLGPTKVDEYNISFAPRTNEVTSDELNSILQNVMAWVVATVTSILYPAITRYEERLQSQVYARGAESTLSSESSSFCSTCSEGFAYGSYTTATTKTFPGEPRAFAMDIAVRHPPTPLKPLSAHVERTVVEKTYHTEGPPSAHIERTVVEKTYHTEGPPSAHVERTVVEKTYSTDGPPVTTTLTYKTATGVYVRPKLRSCKSDSHLLASFQGGARKSKDATTETDGLEGPLLPKRKARAEIKNLEKIFVNFKCHLKGETELILESVFQEIMSDLTQAVPAISSVTAEVFVEASEPELGDVLSNVDISSVASEIVENMLETLQSAVEKKCVEMFSQEDWPVDMTPSFLPVGEGPLPPSARPPPASLPQPGEPMCDMAEDMVQDILKKLMALASGKQDEPPHLASVTKPPSQQRTPGPVGTSLQRADAKRGGPEPDGASFLVKEEIQSLISSIFAQSSLVGYIEEAISTILGYVQTELNNERLVASEETVVFLRLLDDIFTQLHQEPPLPPINVPGMVLYSDDDDSEEIDRIVENALDSSLRNERARSREQDPECWLTGRSARLGRNSKLPPRPASLRSKVVFCEGSKTEGSSVHKKEVLKGKICSSKDTLTFSQDQRHQIQEASANVIKGILTEMLKEQPPPPHPSGGRAGKDAAVLLSGKPRGLPAQGQWDQLFSVGEVNTVAQDITEAVIHILHEALNRIPGTPKSSTLPARRQTPRGRSHTPDVAKEAPYKKPLNIWFDSEKKVKYLSSLDVGPETPSLFGSEACEPKAVDDISGDIIDTVFKKLKGLIYPKLHVGSTPPCTEPSSLRHQLSAYTEKPEPAGSRRQQAPPRQRVLG